MALLTTSVGRAAASPVSAGEAAGNAVAIAGNAMLTIVTSRKARNAASDDTASTHPGL